MQAQVALGVQIAEPQARRQSLHRYVACATLQPLMFVIAPKHLDCLPACARRGSVSKATSHGQPFWHCIPSTSTQTRL